MRVLITHYEGFEGVSVAQDVESVDEAMNIAMKNYDGADTCVVINELTEGDTWGRNWIGERYADGVVNSSVSPTTLATSPPTTCLRSSILTCRVSVRGRVASREFRSQYEGCQFDVVTEEFGEMTTYFTACEVCDEKAMRQGRCLRYERTVPPPRSAG